MIYAHVFFYSRDAEIAFKDFIAERNPTKVRRFGNALSAAFIDEDEHWFMGRATYPRWAMGRTYIDVDDGKLHRSGCRLQTEGAEDETD